MPHLAAAAINNWVAAHPATQIRTLMLGAAEVAAVRPNLNNDASSLLYSAQITFLVEEKANAIPLVAASETGLAQTKRLASWGCRTL
ncbi:hypothetical protein AB0K68_52740, partial [Streptomyces sp. NPDC050698]